MSKMREVNNTDETVMLFTAKTKERNVIDLITS